MISLELGQAPGAENVSMLAVKCKSPRSFLFRANSLNSHASYYAVYASSALAARRAAKIETNLVLDFGARAEKV